MFFLLKPDAFKDTRESQIEEAIRNSFEIVEEFWVQLSFSDVKKLYPNVLFSLMAAHRGFTRRPLRVFVIKDREGVFEDGRMLKYDLRNKLDPLIFLNRLPGIRVGSLLHCPDFDEHDQQILLLRSRMLPPLSIEQKRF